MNAAEEQEEEREVLESIYEGDENFFKLESVKYQYKIGEDGASKSMLVEITWGENYPSELPSINLDAFYNNHLLPEVKDSIVTKLKVEAESLVGVAATYTIFEFAKENMEVLLQEQPKILIVQSETKEDYVPAVAKIKEKKDALTKNQKRRLYDKFGTSGMDDSKPRGWDWVDVVKHLSQTGAKLDGQ